MNNATINIPARAIWQGKEITGIHAGMEEVYLSLEMYTEYLKETTKHKLLQLINQGGKTAWCKIIIQKSIIFLYPNNKNTENEMNNIRTEFLQINSIKDIRHSENCKMSLTVKI